MPVKGQHFTTTSPVNAQPIAESPRSSAEDIENALDVAHVAARGKTSVQDRSLALLKIADRIDQNLELLTVTETWDNGKAVRETLNTDIPLGITILVELIGDLLSPGVLNIVQGFGKEAGEALITIKRIAKIAFTGLTLVGAHIMKYTAENIILSTMVLALFNQGEVCTCPSRALVQESIYDEFMQVVMRTVRQIKRGDPLDTDTMVGAQTSEQQNKSEIGSSVTGNSPVRD